MRLQLTCLLFFATLTPLLGQTDYLSHGHQEFTTLGDTFFSTGLLRVSNTNPQEEALPELAKNLLHDLSQLPPDRPKSTQILVERLKRLQETYTRANYLEEAVALRKHLQEFLMNKEGVQPNPGTLTALRGQDGKQFMFSVTGRVQGSVWGSGIYTDDSNLSSVVVHAGVLAEGESGTVRVTIRPGQEQYEGSEKNGVTSRPYESFGGSYSVAITQKAERTTNNPLPKSALDILADLKEDETKADFKARLKRGAKSLQGLQQRYARANRLNQAVAIRDATFDLLVLLFDAQPAPSNFTQFRDNVGQSAYFYTTGRTTGTIWGSGTYTDDSDLGAAAVHAGLLRPGQKGIVKVMLLLGNEFYIGSSNNGVLSQSYENWQGSYQLETASF